MTTTEPTDRTRGTVMRGLTAGALLCLSLSAAAAEGPFCGDEGVWVQILGAGGPELNDGQGGPAYLVWQDGQARVLVDAGPGASVRFDQAGAKIEDLDAIAFTHLHVDHTADFPAFVKGAYFAERDRPLPVLGPDGDGVYPDTETFVSRLIGPDGAYAYLADFLTWDSSGGFRFTPRNVPATGQRRWARFGTEHVRLAAIPVHHSIVPAIAWRVEVGDQAIVFTGDFNNQKNVMAEFAKDADALVIHHAIPENARGEARELHVTPSQIGRIAADAGVRMVILGHRMTRTLGRESQSRAVIEEHYQGPLIFGNDLECWGL
jgi:ribonuclease BN (tRNA processing enzyme)